MGGKKDNRYFETTALVPGLSAEVCTTDVATKRIPALARVLGNELDRDAPVSAGYEPPRRLFVTENPDDTYAVMNDLTLIRPDLCRIAAVKVSVAIVRFDCEKDREKFRKYLLFVDPTRRKYTGAQFSKKVFQGLLDGVISLFVRPSLDPHGFVAAHSLLTGGEISSATFHRLKDEATPKPNKKSNAIATKKKHKKRRKSKNKKSDPVKTVRQQISWPNLKSGEQGDLF